VLEVIKRIDHFDLLYEESSAEDEVGGRGDEQ
jgi:hypothetical protein